MSSSSKEAILSGASGFLTTKPQTAFKFSRPKCQRAESARRIHAGGGHPSASVVLVGPVDHLARQIINSLHFAPAPAKSKVKSQVGASGEFARETKSNSLAQSSTASSPKIKNFTILLNRHSSSSHVSFVDASYRHTNRV